MAQRPHHIGVKKAWLSWHSQNLEEFRQSQPIVLAQDEVIRRFVRGFFPQNITINGTEASLHFLFQSHFYIACFLACHQTAWQCRICHWLFTTFKEIGYSTHLLDVWFYRRIFITSFEATSQIGTSICYR